MTTSDAETTDGGATDGGSTGDEPGGTTGSESSDGGEDTGEAEALEVLNIQSAASAMNGDSLLIEDYTVPADGVLVVHGGAAGSTVLTVTFGGEALTPVASHEEPEYWFAISSDVYWMPVTAGATGDILWDYTEGEWSTRRRGAIALTIGGADEVHEVAMATDGEGTNEGRTGPSLAEVEITTTQPAVVLTAFTSNGPGPSDLTGPGHMLDAFPTVPIEEFHSTRVYGGHVLADPGTITVGYQNNENNGWFDFILFAVAFT